MEIKPALIPKYIDNFCSLVEYEGPDIHFNLSASLKEPISCSSNPDPIIAINDNFFELEEEVKDELLKQKLCLIAARIKFHNDRLEEGSPEWRYFAFKCGLLVHKSYTEFNTLQVLIEEW